MQNTVTKTLEAGGGIGFTKDYIIIGKDGNPVDRLSEIKWQDNLTTISEYQLMEGDVIFELYTDSNWTEYIASEVKNGEVSCITDVEKYMDQINFGGFHEMAENLQARGLYDAFLRFVGPDSRFYDGLKMEDEEVEMGNHDLDFLKNCDTEEIAAHDDDDDIEH